MNSADDQSKENPSLRYSIRDGMSHAFMLGTGETYFNAFAVFLGAGPLQIGFLASIPALLAALTQAVGVWLMERVKSRRKLIVQGAFTQALALLPMGALAFCDQGSTLAITMLIALAGIYQIFGGLVAPIWNSLIGDLVPAETRGRFFGQRSRLCGLSTFLGVTLAGALLEFFRHRHLSAWGFFIIFVLASGARLVSCWWLSRHQDPEWHHSREHHFSFFQFLRRAPRSNFAKFVFLVGSLNFGAFFAGPFFAVYMLRDLKLDYGTFTILTAAAVFSQFLTLGRWGTISDLFGNRMILNICAVGVSISPLLWLVSSNSIYLLLVQLYSGLMWAGFNLAAASFLFDAVSPPKRGRCAAFQGLVNGTFVCCGSLLGGYMLRHVDCVLPYNPMLALPTAPILTIFLLSGLLRATACALFLPRIKEVRAVKRIKHRELVFRIAQFRAFSGSTFSLVEGATLNTGPGLVQAKDKKSTDTSK